MPRVGHYIVFMGWKCKVYKMEGYPVILIPHYYTPQIASYHDFLNSIIIYIIYI